MPTENAKAVRNITALFGTSTVVAVFIPPPEVEDRETLDLLHGFGLLHNRFGGSGSPLLRWLIIHGVHTHPEQEQLHALKCLPARRSSTRTGTATALQTPPQTKSKSSGYWRSVGWRRCRSKTSPET